MAKTYHQIRKTDTSVKIFAQAHDKVISHYDRVITDSGKLSDIVADALTKTLTTQLEDAVASLKYDTNHKGDHLHTPLSKESVETLSHIRKNCFEILKELGTLKKQFAELKELEKLLDS